MNMKFGTVYLWKIMEGGFLYIFFKMVKNHRVCDS